MTDLEIKFKILELGLMSLQIIVDVLLCVYNNHCHKK
jgi:hypothetical protein